VSLASLAINSNGECPAINSILALYDPSLWPFLNDTLATPSHFNNPLCRLCGEAREESNHIIRKCPALSRSRLNNLLQITITGDWFVLGLLHFLLSPIVARLEDDNRANMAPTPPPSPPPTATSAKKPGSSPKQLQ
jgi:hypothetical protein